jgi:hypothetical protein
MKASRPKSARLEDLHFSRLMFASSCSSDAQMFDARDVSASHSHDRASERERASRARQLTLKRSHLLAGLLFIAAGTFIGLALFLVR